MKEMILAYQGEMTLKGLNRNKFEARLAKSIRYRLEDLGPFQVTQAQSTVFIEPRADGLDMDEAFRRVSKIFGIVKMSRAACCDKDFDTICATAEEYLRRYPSIKVVLDVHRDAIEDADGTRVKPVCTIDGESTAQVMIIAGCDNGSTISLPNWRLNLRFAAAWEEAMESRFPGLTRPVLCGYRFYNQDLTTGSLLIEIGGHANTLEEALRGGEFAARALAELLGG